MFFFDTGLHSQFNNGENIGVLLGDNIANLNPEQVKAQFGDGAKVSLQHGKQSVVMDSKGNVIHASGISSNIGNTASNRKVSAPAVLSSLANSGILTVSDLQQIVSDNSSNIDPAVLSSLKQILDKSDSEQKIEICSDGSIRISSADGKSIPIKGLNLDTLSNVNISNVLQTKLSSGEDIIIPDGQGNMIRLPSSSQRSSVVQLPDGQLLLTDEVGNISSIGGTEHSVQQLGNGSNQSNLMLPNGQIVTQDASGNFITRDTKGNIQVLPMNIATALQSQIQFKCNQSSSNVQVLPNGQIVTQDEHGNMQVLGSNSTATTLDVTCSMANIQILPNGQMVGQDSTGNLQVISNTGQFNQQSINQHSSSGSVPSNIGHNLTGTLISPSLNDMNVQMLPNGQMVAQDSAGNMHLVTKDLAGKLNLCTNDSQFNSIYPSNDQQINNGLGNLTQLADSRLSISGQTPGQYVMSGNSQIPINPELIVNDEDGNAIGVMSGGFRSLPPELMGQVLSSNSANANTQQRAQRKYGRSDLSAESSAVDNYDGRMVGHKAHFDKITVNHHNTHETPNPKNTDITSLRHRGISQLLQCGDRNEILRALAKSAGESACFLSMAINYVESFSLML